MLMPAQPHALVQFVRREGLRESQALCIVILPMRRLSFLSLLIILALMLWQHSAPVATAAPLILGRLLKEGIPVAVCALGSGLVLAAGQVDLSLAGVATAGGVVFAALTQLGVPPFVAILVSLTVGAASGAVLGWIITARQAPALIASWALGTLWIIVAIVFGGLGFVSGTAASISLGEIPPPDFWGLGHAGNIVALGGLLLCVGAIRLSWLSDYACAVGSSSEGSFRAGLNGQGIVRCTFIVNAIFASFAGILWALLNASAPTTEHTGRELAALAIAVYGGTSLSGGVFPPVSIIAAGLFWAGAKTYVDGLDLTFAGALQQHAANAIFAFLLLVVSGFWGRRLIHNRPTLEVRQS